MTTSRWVDRSLPDSTQHRVSGLGSVQREKRGIVYGREMLFNSLHFAIFLPLIVALYWAAPHRYRWALLLAGSYYFYGSWRPEYLVLLVASTGVDYFAALRMAAAGDAGRKRLWLGVSLASNLGMLGYFKYAGFLAESVAGTLRAIGVSVAPHPAFDVLLPIGISFYTLQTLGYAIDVYRGQAEPERHFGRFALYVSFFPQLVAGPIERAGKLLPQFSVVQRFHGGRTISGLTLMGWGFFQKLVIADRLAPAVHAIYTGTHPQTAGAVALGAALFYWQLYADFSGYCDIARGTARTMGFELSRNFDGAYASRSIGEVWRRWHITLMSWFRDYLAKPLGFSRPGRLKWARNVLIVFFVSGLWHGAAWTFIGWGVLTATYIVIGETTRRRRNRLWSAVAAKLEAHRTGATLTLERVRAGLAVVTTFVLMLLSLVFFRAPSTSRALEMYGTLLSKPHTLLQFGGLPMPLYEMVLAIVAIGAFVVVDTIARNGQWAERLERGPRWMRWGAVYVLLLAVLMFGEFGDGRDFLYFQF
jgi:alginate O-acetyltransferase complex protein AlgI